MSGGGSRTAGRNHKVVLVTGISGGLARNVAKRLQGRGDEVVGVDYRTGNPLPRELENIYVYRAKYNRAALEDVFRAHPFTSVLHLGRVGSATEERVKRFDLNVLGTQKLMNLCVEHKLKELVVLSTFYIYGADPRNPTPISEEEPVRAGYQYRQIADAVQLDAMASAWVYRHAEVRTVVLRPTNIVGPSISNTISRLIRMRHAPHIAGFDPMVQFVHEDDLARAIIAALDGNARGIFNVGGGEAIPWRTALALAGAATFPLPASVSRLLARLSGRIPQYVVDFYKYPCVINDTAFRATFGWKPQIGVRETVETAVSAQREGTAH